MKTLDEQYLRLEKLLDEEKIYLVKEVCRNWGWMGKN